jgi:cytochrome P450
LLTFASGPFSCVGKQLALMELRMIITSTVWNYDFEFAPDEDGSTIENETLDLIILKVAKLDLVFRKRKVPI